jgi:hypothetical protein
MPKKKDISASYNSFKEFEGKRYTGMKMGRTHHWYYDKGDWKEKKVTPEKWELTYTTVKRRAGRAPKGAGGHRVSLVYPRTPVYRKTQCQ